MSDNLRKIPAAPPISQPRREEDFKNMLRERGKSHGDFADHARAAQRLKTVFHSELEAREKRGQLRLSDCQIEGIDMILHKIARIIAGDPDFPEHWDDIGGYAEISKLGHGVK